MSWDAKGHLTEGKTYKIVHSRDKLQVCGIGIVCDKGISCRGDRQNTQKASPGCCWGWDPERFDRIEICKKSGLRLLPSRESSNSIKEPIWQPEHPEFTSRMVACLEEMKNIETKLDAWAKRHYRDLGICKHCRTVMGVCARYYNDDFHTTLEVVSECQNHHNGSVLLDRIDPQQFLNV